MQLSYDIRHKSQQILKIKYPTPGVFVASIFKLQRLKRSHSEAFCVYNFIVSFINSDSIHPEYAFIAKKLGISKKTVERSVHWLRKVGLLWTIRERDPLNPKKYMALEYILPSYLYDLSIRKQLIRLLPACGIFLTWTLGVAINAAGLVIRESVVVFSLRYIREERKEHAVKKKRRITCIIAPDNYRKPHYVNNTPFLSDTFLKREANTFLNVLEPLNNVLKPLKKEFDNEIGSEASTGCPCLNGQPTCVFGEL